MELGDIFQVTEDDMKTDAMYIFGDFYIAKPKASGSVGFTRLSWHQFLETRVDRLPESPASDVISRNVATIYANGQHCAAVNLYFTPTDDNGNKIPFSERYFAEVLEKYETAFPFKLIQYLGNDLPDGWSSLTAPTPFTADVPSRGAQAAALARRSALRLGCPYAIRDQQQANRYATRYTGNHG